MLKPQVIINICNSYQAGFDVGKSCRPNINPYQRGTNEYRAWSHGYRIGRGYSECQKS